MISRLPISVQRFFVTRALGIAIGDMTTYGLPKPDHKLFEAHPTVSSELLPRLGHGDIEVKPNIERFTGGRGVRFADRSEEEIDLVVYCTGYKMTFPFFAPEVFAAHDNRLPLYNRVVSAERPGALLHRVHSAAGPDHAARRGPVRSGSPTCSQAARRCRRLTEMRRDIAGEEGRMKKRFVASKRHTVEVDFYPYLRQLRRARKQAAAPALTTLGAPAGRAGRQRRGGAAAVRAPARATRRLRLRPAPFEAAFGTVPRSRAQVPLLAHQTSQIDPTTGIFKTTSKKKIGQNPVTSVSVASQSSGH